MEVMEIWKKHVWNGLFHPEIEKSETIPHEQKETIQFILEVDFDNDFDAMIQNMWAYALLIEDYESAAEIRDYFKDKEE